MGEAIQNASNVNLMALLFLVAMSFVILLGSRRSAVAALLAMAAFIPLGQEIYVFGLHFYFLRILILVGTVRLLARQETVGFKLNSVDKMIIAWRLVVFICSLIREPSPEVFGVTYDDLGIYFVFRLLMRDGEDASEYLRILAFVGIVIGACMIYEDFTRRNPFFIFGGVPEMTVIRDTRFRCQGPFRHPILAGTFGATLFPLMVGLWQQRGRGRSLALAGIIASLAITVVSASSGPLLTFMAAVLGFALWSLRERMHLFRRSIVAVLIVLSLVMTAPVWYLISRLSDLFGGSGWHRSWLIDQFLTHITQWCYIGTDYTANWAPAGEVMQYNPNMMDITNHYVTQGIKGGALGLYLFIAGIVACFKIVGRAVWSDSEWSYHPRLAWALGISLACHCTAFISVSYFDQLQVFWFWLLAAIAVVPEQALRKAGEENSIPEAENFDDSFTAVGPQGN
jgi:hypothetical protein